MAAQTELVERGRFELPITRAQNMSERRNITGGVHFDVGGCVVVDFQPGRRSNRLRESPGGSTLGPRGLVDVLPSKPWLKLEGGNPCTFRKSPRPYSPQPGAQAIFSHRRCGNDMVRADRDNSRPRLRDYLSKGLLLDVKKTLDNTRTCCTTMSHEIRNHETQRCMPFVPACLMIGMFGFLPVAPSGRAEQSRLEQSARVPLMHATSRAEILRPGQGHIRHRDRVPSVIFPVSV